MASWPNLVTISTEPSQAGPAYSALSLYTHNVPLICICYVLYLSSNNISHHAPPCHLEPDLKAAVWVEPGVIGMSDCTRQARTPYGIHACIWNLNCKICIFVFVIWSWFLLAVQSVSEFHFILSYQLAPLLTLITALRAFELQQTSLWQKSDPDKVFCRELNRKQADSPT